MGHLGTPARPGAELQRRIHGSVAARPALVREVGGGRDAGAQSEGVHRRSGQPDDRSRRGGLGCPPELVAGDGQVQLAELEVGHGSWHRATQSQPDPVAVKRTLPGARTLAGALRDALCAMEKQRAVADDGRGEDSAEHRRGPPQ